MIGFIIAITLAKKFVQESIKEKLKKNSIKAHPLSTELTDSDKCFKAYSAVVNLYTAQGANTPAPTATPVPTATPAPTATPLPTATPPPTETPPPPPPIERQGKKEEKENNRRLRIDGQTTKIASVSEDELLDAFSEQCKKTATNDECATLLIKLKAGGSTADKDSFAEKCNVPDPNAGEDNSSGLLATKTSKILIMMSIAIANLYFKL
jgi:hypothetical protein